MADHNADTERLGSGAYVTVLRSDLVRLILHADSFTPWGTAPWEARERLMAAALTDGSACA